MSVLCTIYFAKQATKFFSKKTFGDLSAECFTNWTPFSVLNSIKSLNAFMKLVINTANIQVRYAMAQVR